MKIERIGHLAMQDSTQRTFTFTPSSREYDIPEYGETRIPRSVPEEHSTTSKGGFFARLIISMLLFGGVLLAKNSTSTSVQTFASAVGESFSAEYALPENGIVSFLVDLAAFDPVSYPHLSTPAEGTIVRSFGQADDGGSPCLGIILSSETQGGVYASTSGTVITTDESEMLGKYVVIESEDGLRTIYGCCGEIFAAAGESVTENTQIATMAVGNNGQYYLYFEVQQNERAIDPQKCFQQAEDNT